MTNLFIFWGIEAVGLLDTFADRNKNEQTNKQTKQNRAAGRIGHEREGIRLTPAPTLPPPAKKNKTAPLTPLLGSAVIRMQVWIFTWSLDIRHASCSQQHWETSESKASFMFSLRCLTWGFFLWNLERIYRTIYSRTYLLGLILIRDGFITIKVLNVGNCSIWFTLSCSLFSLEQ